MALVVAIIAVIIGNYQQLVARYPQGGGLAAAAGEAFGEAWSFVPIGALIVDFALTISSAPPPAPRSHRLRARCGGLPGALGTSASRAVPIEPAHERAVVLRQVSKGGFPGEEPMAGFCGRLSYRWDAVRGGGGRRSSGPRRI
jgi:hypothetical protein